MAKTRYANPAIVRTRPKTSSNCILAYTLSQPTT
jgi:hypothetical protein